MILLDTDHVTVLRYRDSAAFARLSARLDAATDRRHAVTVITVEEQMRGWMAELARHKTPRRQVATYDRLAGLFQFFQAWEIVRFDEPAADRFLELKRQRLHVGSQDLRIAAIALVNGALLLSANLHDFGHVPNLRVENWLRD